MIITAYHVPRMLQYILFYVCYSISCVTYVTVYLVLRMLQYILCYVCYSISRAQVTEIDDDNVDLPLASSGSVLTLQYTINGTKSGRLLLSISSSKL